jgi:hypothetical protein
MKLKWKNIYRHKMSRTWIASTAITNNYALLRNPNTQNILTLHFNSGLNQKRQQADYGVKQKAINQTKNKKSNYLNTKTKHYTFIFKTGTQHQIVQGNFSPHTKIGKITHCITKNQFYTINGRRVNTCKTIIDYTYGDFLTLVINTKYRGGNVLSKGKKRKEDITISNKLNKMIIVKYSQTHNQTSERHECNNKQFISKSKSLKFYFSRILPEISIHIDYDYNQFTVFYNKDCSIRRITKIIKNRFGKINTKISNPEFTAKYKVIENKGRMQLIAFSSQHYGQDSSDVKLLYDFILHEKPDPIQTGYYHGK